MTRLGWISATLLGITLITGTWSDKDVNRVPLHAGAYRVISADLHVHTFPWSAGTIAPWDVPGEASRQRLDAVAVTGHNETISGKAAKWWWRIAGGPTVIAGEEIHGPAFHVIALGIHSTIDWRLNAAEAIDEVHRQGGVAIAAHPSSRFWPAFEQGGAMEKLDGTEVAHPLKYGHPNYEHDFENFYARSRAAPIGSSDFHGLGPIGLCRTYIFARDGSEEAILDAIRARRTIVIDQGRAYGDHALIELARRAGLPESISPEGPWAFVSRVSGVVGLLAAALCGLTSSAARLRP